MTFSAPDGLLPSGELDRQIHVGSRSTLAWDVLGLYGAVFSMWLSAQGEVQLEAEILREEGAGC